MKIDSVKKNDTPEMEHFYPSNQLPFTWSIFIMLSEEIASSKAIMQV